MELNIIFNITKFQPVFLISNNVIYYTFNWVYRIIAVGQVGPYSVATKTIYVHVYTNMHNSLYTYIYNL